MNVERIDKYFSKLLNDNVEKKIIPGAVVGVYKDGQEVYQKQFGYSDIGKKQLMKKDTIFRIYSMTKPVTAAAMMILYERGMIDIYEPVSRYLKGFENQKMVDNGYIIPVRNQSTIKDLLNMTAGLVYPSDTSVSEHFMEELFTRAKTDREKRNISISTIDFANEIGRVPLKSNPGTKWNYSTCADIIGAIIEVVSGMKYSEFLKKEIFDPLEMDDTGFYVPEEKQYRFAKLYEYNSESEFKVCEWTHLGLTDRLTPPSFESGGAGLVSTLGDYAKFCNMLLNMGTYNGKEILGRKTVEYMTKNSLTDKQLHSMDWDSLKGYGYGNLMRVMIDPSKSGSLGSVGEYGWSGWAGTYMLIDPVEKLVFIYMIQKADGDESEYVRKMKNIIYSSL